MIGECLAHNYYPPGYDDEDLFQDLRAKRTAAPDVDDLRGDSYGGGDMPRSIDTTGAESSRTLTQSISAEGDATPPIGTTVSEAMPKKKGMNKISARYR